MLLHNLNAHESITGVRCARSQHPTVKLALPLLALAALMHRMVRTGAR